MMQTTPWIILFTDRFHHWLLEQDEATQNTILANLQRLKIAGPQLSRPYADRVYGSQYANMKELRIQHQGKPLRAFLLLIRFAKQLFYVPVTKVTIRNFMKK